MTAPERRLFERYLRAASWYLEFGSGGSTREAVRQGVARVTSIESDAAWLRAVAACPDVQAAGVELVHVDIGPTGKWGFPVGFDHATRWPDYPRALGDRTPDTVLVDGRFRVACAMNALARLDDGFVLLVHDYNRRPHYRVLEDFFNRIESAQSLHVFGARAAGAGRTEAARACLESAWMDPR